MTAILPKSFFQRSIFVSALSTCTPLGFRSLCGRWCRGACSFAVVTRCHKENFREADDSRGLEAQWHDISAAHALRPQAVFSTARCRTKKLLVAIS